MDLILPLQCEEGTYRTGENPNGGPDSRSLLQLIHPSGNSYQQKAERVQRLRHRQQTTILNRTLLHTPAVSLPFQSDPVFGYYARSPSLTIHQRARWAHASATQFQSDRLELCHHPLIRRFTPYRERAVLATPFGQTVDGFETQFGTNHLGHFVLVNRIAPLIRTGGRLINLASSGHRFSNVDLDPNFQQTAYDPFVAYGRSKTANILFAVAFDQRHRGRGVRA